MVLSYTHLFAQFKNIIVSKAPTHMEIVQVDHLQSSTLVFIKYVNQNFGWCNIWEQTYVKVKGDTKKYHLINSINMPIHSEAENKYMLFDDANQLHHFVLEFERFPENMDFDIIEDEKNPSAFNFYGVHVADYSKGDYMDIDKFIADTPVKEMGRYLKDGVVINYIKANGIIITTCIQAVRQYGTYFVLYVDIQNFSGKKILFSLANVTATGYTVKKDKIDKIFPLEVLTASEYDRKVANRQAWNNLAVAFNESMAAYNAGRSSSTTTYTGSSYTIGSASVRGYAGNTYGYANAYGSVYTTSYGRSHTESYNGAAAYAAQQKANENYANYANSQYEIRQHLNDEYIKDNTIQNQMEYSGYFNIKYKKINNLQVVFTIAGTTFPFTF